MTDLERMPEPAAIVGNPATGEIIDLSGPTDQLAKTLSEVRILEQQLRVFKDHVAREITARLDVENTRSATVGGWKVTATAPVVWETDLEPLREKLVALVGDGVLSMRAVEDAVERVVGYKAHRKGLKMLRTHPDARVREVVAEHDREVANAQRRVSVSEARS